MSKAKVESLQAFNPAVAGNPKQSLITVARKVGRAIAAGKPKAKYDANSGIGFAWVPADKLYINYTRQRYPEPKHIKKLMGKWNIFCVTPLTARYSKTEDRYYISDGQQHSIGWILTYGEDTELPVFYVDSENEQLESVQLLALNCDNERMAPYFIHQQEIVMGDAAAVALENAVTAADCKITYNKRSAGTITNLGHIYKARDNFALGDITEVLTRMRQTWPTKSIQTDVLRGLLHVKKLMTESKTYKEEVFEDILHEASIRYADDNGVLCPKVLFNAIQEQCRVSLETTAIDAESKVSSGLLSIYEQVKSKDVVKGKRPFKDITMTVVVQ